MEVLQFVPQLGKALWSLKLMYDQHVDNKVEIKELQSFIRDYDKEIPALQMRFKGGGGNVMGMVALKNLEKEVVEATNKLERWSRDNSFFRVFTSMERMQKLEKWHSRVMACVQKNLGIASVSMLLDLQATQATILDSHTELKSLLITNIVNMQGTLPMEVREEVVEASTSSFGDPKFWEDILAAVDNHQGGSSLGKEKKNVYEDPISTNLMIDPVVASDGNTYCRWTIIDNNLTTSPFNVDEDLTIVIDNLHLQRGLFEMFPEQSQIFRQRRNEYRSCAFSLKAKELLGDVALALHHVLEWDKRDVECVEALKQVQRGLQEAKEKYLQASKGPSNELRSGGPIVSSMHEMMIELDEACELFLDISSSILEVQHQALYGVCHWSARNAHFWKYVFEKEGVRLLTWLLSSLDHITQGHALSTLLHLSLASGRDACDLYNFQEALEPLVVVLNSGSDQACEQAARILCNLTYFFCILDRAFLQNPSVLNALETSLSDRRPLQVQQLVSCTLNYLFSHVGEEAGKVLIPILLRLISKEGLPLEEGLPLLYRLMCKHDITDQVFRDSAPPSLWLDLVASSSEEEASSSVDQERAAVIVCHLCIGDEEYRQQAIESLVIEQFYKLIRSSTTRRAISIISRRDSKPPPELSESITFPPKKWWVPPWRQGGEKVWQVTHEKEGQKASRKSRWKSKRWARLFVL